MHICKYSSAPLQHPLSCCLQRACFLAYFQLGLENKDRALVGPMFVLVPGDREAQGGTGRHRESQGVTGRHREAQGGTGRHREAQGTARPPTG